MLKIKPVETMENNRSKILEKMYGKKVLTEAVRIETIKEKVTLDIYDGYAEGTLKDGRQVMLEFPQVAPVKESPDMVDSIMDYLDDVTDKEQITPIQVMQTFAKLYINGVRVTVKPKKKKETTQA